MFSIKVSRPCEVAQIVGHLLMEISMVKEGLKFFAKNDLHAWQYC